MTTATALFALLGAGVGLGLWLVTASWRRPAGLRRQFRLPRHDRRQLAIAAAVGVAGGVVTGWVVGAVLIGLAAWSLPRLMARDKHQARQLAGSKPWPAGRK